jgi:hypothetical protein
VERVGIGETLAQQGVEHDECRLRGGRGSTLDGASDGGQGAESVNGPDVRVGGPADVMDDVTLDPAGAAVEPGDVNPGEVDAPGVDAMRQESGDMTQRHRVTEGVQDGAAPDQVSVDLVGDVPDVSERVVAAPEPVPRPLPHHEADRLVVVPDLTGHGTGEESVLLTEIPKRVHPPL